MRKIPKEPTPTLDLLDERACAFHQTVVFQRQAYPNMALMTYDNQQHRGAEHLILAKFVVGIGNDSPIWLTYDTCDDRSTADNVTGGLKSTAVTNDGIQITSEIYPLLVGRETMAWEGAALIRIQCEAHVKVWMKFGNGNISFMHFSPNKELSGEKINCEQGNSVVDENVAFITSKDRPIVTAVKGSFQFTGHRSEGDDPHANGGHYIIAEAYGQKGYIIAGFAADKGRAAALASLNPEMEYRRVLDYYKAKLENWYIRTPSDTLNQAFAHALLNVEYSWLRPYGWIECIHHWPTMWHMEQTAADEWAGNADRTRECLRSQMKNLLESGAVPDMCTNGKGRRDWGGNNQFFFREVDHYLKMTGDLEFALEAEPFMEKVLAQTFREYDPTGSGLLSWGTQIGNQEDFECTPGAGAATGSEGIRMLEIMADFKAFLGKTEEAERHRVCANTCLADLRNALWLKDLGRYGWYRDIRGQLRLETTYHGIVYPVLYNQIDDIDKMSAMDHLRHRLSGPDGEVYQSNHFGDHAYDSVPTWGMQCGSDMQPFASAAYAKVGMRNDAIRPLEFVAERVCGLYQRGSWPETANEKRFAYFSPSAAVFSQAIVESIFGVTIDKPHNLVTISPCFPDRWECAELKVPGVNISYHNQQNKHCFTIIIDGEMEKIFKWKLPPYKCISAQCDGQQIEVGTSTGCGWFEATVTLPNQTEIRLDIEYVPLEIVCKHDAWVACGQLLELEVWGAELLRMDDRCGIFDSLEIQGNRIRAVTDKALLDQYDKFGYLGIMNFARRQFTLKLCHDGRRFDYPCTIVLVPAVQCRGTCSGNELQVEIHNRTKTAFDGVLWLQLSGEGSKSHGKIAAGGKAIFTFSLSSNQQRMLSPGQNKAKLYWQQNNAPSRCFAYDLRFDAGERSVRILSVTLDDDLLKPAVYWQEIGWHRSHGHMKQGPACFMENLFENHRDIMLLETVPLVLNPKGFLPLSMEKHRIMEIPLNGLKAKKIFILMSAFIDNHDVYSAVFKLELEGEQADAFIQPVFTKVLTYPGELDMGFGNAVIAGFATFVNGTDRMCMPVLPSNGQGDYPEAIPPAYPQRQFWCGNRTIEACNTVFNLIEFDLGSFQELKTLRIHSEEAHTAGGIFAIAAHIPDE